jgi:hypothetical protein
MVLNKKPVEKNRNILNRKGKKISLTNVENWVRSEDFAAAHPPERSAPPEQPCAEPTGGDGSRGVESISMESMVRKVNRYKILFFSWSLEGLW